MKKNAIFGLLVILLAFCFISCDDGNENGNGDTEEVFTSSTDETISNDKNTLGLVGTSVSSSNSNVATAVLLSLGKIKITSVSNGSAVITVSENTNNATINVSVSKTGSITIGTITKYIENTNNENNELIGIWQIETENGTFVYDLKKDGTGIFYTHGAQLPFKYSIANEEIIININGKTPGTNDDDDIVSYSLKNDKLSVTVGELIEGEWEEVEREYSKINSVPEITGERDVNLIGSWENKSYILELYENGTGKHQENYPLIWSTKDNKILNFWMPLFSTTSRDYEYTISNGVLTYYSNTWNKKK